MWVAYTYMDFQKSTDINMDIHDLWMSVFNYPYKCVYPHWYPSWDIHDILQGISVNNKYPWMDIHVLYILVFNYLYAFMDIHLDIPWFLWISMHWLAMDSRSRGRYSISVYLPMFASPRSPWRSLVTQTSWQKFAAPATHIKTSWKIIRSSTKWKEQSHFSVTRHILHFLL